MCPYARGDRRGQTDTRLIGHGAGTVPAPGFLSWDEVDPALGGLPPLW